MDKLNKNIRNKFRQESELPESYSWDNIGESIVQKTVGISVKRRSHLLKNLFLFGGSTLLLLLISTFYFYSNQQKEEFKTTVSENLVEKENYKHKVETEKLSAQQTPEINKVNENLIVQNTTEAIISSQKKNTTAKQSPVLSNNDLEIITVAENQPSEVKKNVDFLDLSSTIQPTDSNATKQVSNFAVANQDNRDKKASNDSQRTASEYLSPIDLLSSIGLTQLSREATVPPMPLLDSENMISPLSKPSKTSIHWGAGLSYWLPELNGEALNTEDRRTKEIGLVSYASSLGLKYKLSNQWNIYVGLDYTNFSSKLEYYDSRDTTIVENVLVSSQTNVLTGEIEESYADHEFEGFSWNEVIHFNDYKLLSVPVVLSRSVATSSRASFDIGTGLRYSRFFTPKGRGLALTSSDHTKYKVVDLAERDLKNASIDFLLSTSFQYQLSNKLSCGVQLSATWSPMDLDPSEELSFKPLGLVSQIRLGYSF